MVYRLRDAGKRPVGGVGLRQDIQRSRDPHEVILKCDPGDSELSKVEENLIAEIFAADGAKDRFELA